MPDLKKILSGFDNTRRHVLSPEQVKQMLEQMGGVSSDG